MFMMAPVDTAVSFVVFVFLYALVPALLIRFFRIPFDVAVVVALVVVPLGLGFGLHPLVSLCAAYASLWVVRSLSSGGAES